MAATKKPVTKKPAAKKPTAKKPAAKKPTAKKPSKAKQPSVLHIGIDLGTSRSVIAAANGKREWVESYVGWPKDFIARKVLGKPVLFGQEALDHKLSLELIRPLANGIIKEGTERAEESVSELLGHLIERIVDNSDAPPVHAAVGVPADALKVNRLTIQKAVSKFAEKLVVVTEPFAVAYGVNALDNAMIIDIGAGTVDFCIMHGAVPNEDDLRSLTSAGDYIDQQLLELLQERYPAADFSLNMVRRFKEAHAFVGNPRGKKAQVQVPVQGRMISHDITSELQQACESILPAIAETLMDMIAKFDPEFQERVRANIILAGGSSQIEGIERYLSEATSDFAPCKFSRIDDPLYAGAEGALGLAQDMPAEEQG